MNNKTRKFPDLRYFGTKVVKRLFQLPWARLASFQGPTQLSIDCSTEDFSFAGGESLIRTLIIQQLTFVLIAAAGDVLSNAHAFFPEIFFYIMGLHVQSDEPIFDQILDRPKWFLTWYGSERHQKSLRHSACSDVNRLVHSCDVHHLAFPHSPTKWLCPSEYKR